MKILRGVGLLDPSFLPLLTLPALIYQLFFTDIGITYSFAVVCHIFLLFGVYFSLPKNLNNYLSDLKGEFSLKLKSSLNYTLVFAVVLSIGLISFALTLTTYLDMLSSGINNSMRLDYFKSNRFLDIILQQLTFCNLLGTLSISNKHTDRLYMITLVFGSFLSFSRASIIFMPIYLIGFLQLRYNFHLYDYVRVSLSKISRLLIPKKVLYILSSLFIFLVIIIDRILYLASSSSIIDVLPRLITRVILSTNGYLDMHNVSNTMGAVIKSKYNLFSYLLHPIYLIFGSRGYETTLGAFVNQGNLAGGSTVGLFSIIATLAETNIEAFVLIFSSFILLFFMTKIFINHVFKNVRIYPLIIVFYFSIVSLPLAIIDEYSYISFKIALFIGSLAFSIFLVSFIPKKDF